jgi:hypothetical protein
MAKQEIGFEVTSCTLQENGDVLVSPDRARGVLCIVLGLPIALVSICLLISEPDKLWTLGLFGPVLGGALVYVGIRALVAPKILVEIASRAVYVGSRGSQSCQTWSFDDLNKQPLDVSTTQLGFSLIRANLRLGDGKSLLLFATADESKAQKAVEWLRSALESAP